MDMVRQMDQTTHIGTLLQHVAPQVAAVMRMIAMRMRLQHACHPPWLEHGV